MKKKIILVVDTKDWAFDYIAKYLVNLSQDKYDTTIIYSSDYSSYEEFLDHLNSFKEVALIHFFYRIYIYELMYHFLLINPIDPTFKDPKFKVLFDTAITTSVPDNLFLKEQDIIKNKSIFSFVDNYYTVSTKLHDIYNGINQYPKPSQEVIYDNILLSDLEKNSNKVNDNKLTITWIGNSKSGETYFGKDYDLKGLNSIVFPCLAEVKNNMAINSHIIDGNTAYKSKAEILKILGQTDILLISSKHEGTPLPLIEAMASGCAVISTDVGIVCEVLPKNQQQFILQDADGFAAAILKLDNDRELLSKLKLENFKAYQNIFQDNANFTNKWTNFIENSINQSRKEQRYNEKKDAFNVLLVHYLITNKINNNIIKKIVGSLGKSAFCRTLINKLYFCRRNIINIVYFCRNSINYIKHKLKEKLTQLTNLLSTEEKIFSRIYDTGHWLKGSGLGSTEENTVGYRKVLQQYFNDPKYKTYVDLGCGDWQIMSLIDIPQDKIYKGYDIVKTVIEANDKKFSKDNVTFHHSINIDEVVEADLLIIKDVLIHWPNKRIQYFIDKILPKFKYALITDGYDEKQLNKDINLGSFRFVDIAAAPFNVKNIKTILNFTAHGYPKRIYFYTNPNNKK